MSTVERLLRNNADVLAAARRLLHLPKPEGWLGAKWHELKLSPARLRPLVEEGVFRVGFRSNSTTTYLLSDEARQALTTLEKEPLKARPTPTLALFDAILGYEQEKRWVLKALTNKQPTHLLLAGPPATAKSMFLDVIASLPDAHFALGGTSSRAGIADFLLQFQPRILVLDELDKMGAEDFSVLLSLMQSGTVTRMKKGMHDTAQLKTRVFAGCNRAEKLPPELRSRFFMLHFKPYTKEDFAVLVEELCELEGMEPEMARYLAEQAAERTHDVRQALHIAKLADSKEEIDALVQAL